MLLETPDCPLCDSPRHRRLYALRDRVWGKPGRFFSVECLSCGARYLAPRPTPDHIGFYYQDLYNGPGLEIEERLQGSFLARLLNRGRLDDLFRRRQPKSGEIHLDVGCGIGAFIAEIKTRTRARAIGLDFEKRAIEAVEKRGGEGFCGTLEEVPLEPASVATLSMLHYLEHSFDPRGDLRRSFQLLEPGGAILIEVPSGDAWGRAFFRAFWFPHLAPQHLTLFDRKTLSRALEEAGFQTVQIREVAAPLAWVSSLFLLWQGTLGSKSRHQSHPVARVLNVAAAPFLLPAVLFDFVLALVLPLSGGADHIRAVANKPKMT